MFFESRLSLMSRLLCRRLTWTHLSGSTRASLHTTCRTCAKPLANNEPIKYSNSKANNWKSYESFTTKPSERSPYQGLSIVASMAAFLVYFCILREENDIDDYMGTSLYKRIPGLEEKQLMVRIEYDQQNGIDTSELQKRLREIRGTPVPKNA